MSKAKKPVLAVIEGGVADRMAENALHVARNGADWAKERGISVIGYSVVLLGADGGMYVGAQFDNTETPSAMNAYAFIGMVTEVLRETLITQSCAVDVFNNQQV